MRFRTAALPPVPLVLAALVPAGCFAADPGAGAAARTAFQQDVSIEIPAGTLFATSQLDVPAGRRLVIEYISGSVRVADVELVRVNVTTTAGGTVAMHTIPNHVYRRDFDPPTGDDLIVTYGQALRLYADPGAPVTFTATRSENREVTPTRFQLAVSGHLLDCRPGPGCPF